VPKLHKLQRSPQKHNSKTTMMINPLIVLIVVIRTTSHTRQANDNCFEASQTARGLTPAERHRTRPVGPFLDKRLVKLSTGRRVDSSPTRLTVILQAGHVGAEEWSELSTTVYAGTFVADLVVKNIWLHFNLVINHRLYARSTQPSNVCGMIK